MIRKKHYRSKNQLSDQELVESGKFEYNIATKIMENLDSRSNSIMTSSTSLSLLKSGVIIFSAKNILNSPSDRLYEFYFMLILICIVSTAFYLSSILLCSHSYKPTYFECVNNEIKFTKKPEIPDFDDFVKFWMNLNKLSLITNILGDTLGKYKIAERKAYFLDKALKLQIFGVINFSVGSIVAFILVLLH